LRSEVLAVNTYEGMFLLDSNRYTREPTAVSGQITEMVRKHDGEILASRLWEERRLAYPVEGHRKGSYWLAYFKLDSNNVARIQRECQLSDSILRALILKVDPRIAEALVSHAKAGTEAKKPPAPTPAPVAAPAPATVAAPAEEAEAGEA
jgi:small subunit ribosomal protein S6